MFRVSDERHLPCTTDYVTDIPMPRTSIRRLPALIFVSLLFLASFVRAARAQEAGPEQPLKQDDEVVRIDVNLVQTDVMVLDKQGRFVDNLQREQFDLRLDGRPQAISFFERVMSGSSREEAQLAAARDGRARPAVAGASANNNSGRGRAVFFFVDDSHLSFDSVVRTRKLLQRFVDEEMGDNEQAVIVSTSGQIGFLQQLTDDKSVLRAAAARINYRPRASRLHELERPSISEFEALAIDRDDYDAVRYFIEQTIKENPGLDSKIAENTVRRRARQILEQAAEATASTLLTLESLVRSSSQWPGRKLIFFISDGMFLDTHTSSAVQQLESVTDAAARSGVVIYTMDARGLTSGLPDASSSTPADPTARLSRIDGGEMSASQDMLHILAADTGGRALLNTNALDKALSKALEETSAYYLIAWQPDRREENANKFRRIALSIKGHPELTVQVRRGFYASTPVAQPVKAKSKTTTTTAQAVPAQTDELRAALGSLYPRTALPVYLSLSYVNAANAGTTLTASIQLAAVSQELTEEDDAPEPTLDVLCVVFDDKGKTVSSVKEQVSFNQLSDAQAEQPRRALYNKNFRLAPGLYQVRVAARDSKSGRTGSATRWIEIPNIDGGDFALGNLLVAEHVGETDSMQADDDAPETVRLSADRFFARNSRLRFVTFIYNARSQSAAPPDVMIEVKVLRDGQPLITMPFKHVETKATTDLARIPYAAEVALGELTPGRYVLQVTALDRATKKTATQQFKFVVK